MKKTYPLMIPAIIIYLGLMVGVSIVGLEPSLTLKLVAGYVLISGVLLRHLHRHFGRDHRIVQTHVAAFGLMLLTGAFAWWLACATLVVFGMLLRETLAAKQFWNPNARSRWWRSMITLGALAMLPLVFLHGPIDETGGTHILMLLAALGMFGHWLATKEQRPGTALVLNAPAK